MPTIGSMMDSVHAVFSPTQTVAEATAQLRELIKTVFVTYGLVCDPQGRLVGVITTRDLLLAEQSTQLRG
ncbi:MAG: CBS domain-containing protein [Phycisphaerales bacterium]|nr:CBS domain-containing protein [Phycisphaerales bacterium]